MVKSFARHIIQAFLWVIFLKEVLTDLLDDILLPIRCNLWLMHDGVVSHFNSIADSVLMKYFQINRFVWAERLRRLNALPIIIRWNFSFVRIFNNMFMKRLFYCRSSLRPYKLSRRRYTGH